MYVPAIPGTKEKGKWMPPGNLLFQLACQPLVSPRMWAWRGIVSSRGQCETRALFMGIAGRVMRTSLMALAILPCSVSGKLNFAIRELGWEWTMLRVFQLRILAVG